MSAPISTTTLNTVHFSLKSTPLEDKKQQKHNKHCYQMKINTFLCLLGMDGFFYLGFALHQYSKQLSCDAPWKQKFKHPLAKGYLFKYRGNNWNCF